MNTLYYISKFNSASFSFSMAIGIDALRNHKDYTFFTTITIDQLMGVIVIDDKSQGFAALAVFLRQKQADYQQAVSDVPAAFTSVSADPAGQDGDDDCLLEAGRQIPMI